MTYFVIVLFSAAVWMSKGHYSAAAPFLVISFIAWVSARMVRRAKAPSNAAAKAELYFHRVFPWVAAVMIALKPNLTYVEASLGAACSLFRLVPIGLNVIPRKILPWAFLLFFMAVLWLSPNPLIDVFRSNSLAAGFFLRGLNPYSQSYPDIYGGQFDYRPGFLYWPGALFLQTLSKVVFGDWACLEKTDSKNESYS